MTARRVALLTAAVLAVAGLAACKEGEQGRILAYQKGTYLGRPATPLSQEALDGLAARTAYQRGPAPRMGPAPPASGLVSVRPPANAYRNRMGGF